MKACIYFGILYIEVLLTNASGLQIRDNYLQCALHDIWSIDPYLNDTKEKFVGGTSYRKRKL